MTENKIEKKATIWPWILLGILILAVVLYFLFFRNNTNDNTAAGNTDDTTQTALINVHEDNDTVASYITFVKGDISKMAVDHSYSSTALMKLVAATRAMDGAPGFDIKANLDKAEDDTKQITKDPMAINHADLIKDAASRISTALQKMQRSEYPSLNMEAEAVNSAATAINPDVLTLDQKQTVQTYFDKAADLLEKMN